jgi:GNAT superfamily N-acetyltransferase
VQRGDRVEQVPLPHRWPTRSTQEWAPAIGRWQGFVRDRGTAIGAFDGDRLVGIAVMRLRLTKDTDELAGLYVDRAWRRRGVATMLVDEVERLARERGAKRLYVSSSEADAAVGFYLNRGFGPTDSPHPELLALEPRDIHMVLDL